MEPEDLAQQTGVNKGLCFPNADNGLVIERYQKQDGKGEENLLTSNLYVLRRNSKTDLNHALRVKGNVLVEGALKAVGAKEGEKGFLKCDVLDVYHHIGFFNPKNLKEDPKIVDKGWLDNVQAFYNDWGNLATKTDVQNVQSNLQNSGYIKGDDVKSSYSGITNVSGSLSVQGAFNDLYYLCNHLLDRILALEKKK